MFHHKIHAQLIMDMLQDKKGNIWFSSWNGGGVWRYDPAAARRTGVDSFTNFSPSADYYLSNEDGRSFNKADNDPLKYSRPKATVDYRPKDFIHDDMIESISEDKAGNPQAWSMPLRWKIFYQFQGERRVCELWYFFNCRR
jgi:hypothetical protein